MMTPLLLAGGRSTRMGSRKELLSLIKIPIYEQQLLRLHLACPESDTVFLSLPNHDSLTQILQSPNVERLTQNTLRLRHQSGSIPVHVLYDRENDDPEAQEKGPAAGLLAAHAFDKNASWLVVACDYPFFSISAARQLRDGLAGPVTCFENSDGIYEPLLGIWTPPALSLLEENVKKGILGPKSVVAKSKGKAIRPQNEHWLFNMNTPAEFEQAKQMSNEISAITEDMAHLT